MTDDTIALGLLRLADVALLGGVATLFLNWLIS